MTIKIFDRIKQKTVTSGTGNITLGDTINSFVSFSGVYNNGDQTYYTIENLTDFEIGIGTYSGNTLSRDTILNSSNSGNHLDLPGDSNTFVFVTYPASGAVYTSGDRSIIDIEKIKFTTSGNFQITNTDNSSLVVITDSGTGVIFEVLDSGNNELFTITDTDSTVLQLTAQVNQSDNIIEIRNSSNVLVASVGVSGDITFGSFSDANRPAAGNAGRVIFNTTDGNLNIDNGSNWILPDGTTT